MDIVIPLADNSYTRNLELRYALRSIQKHLTGIDKIYLVGFKPDWIQNVVHVPVNEILGERFRDMNMRKKLAIACSMPEISEDILYFHDDHFLLQNMKAEKFPLHHKGKLQDTLKIITIRNPYRDVIMNTIKFLLTEKKDTLDFDTHCPMIINRKLFIEKTNHVDHRKPFGVKSLFGNLADLKGSYFPDLKIGTQTAKAVIIDQIKGRPYFSTGDRACGPDLISVFDSLYPKPSKYEINE